MGAVLVLVGVPMAFAATVVFLMTVEHAIGAVIGIGLIAAMLAFLVGALAFIRGLEPPER